MITAGRFNGCEGGTSGPDWFRNDTGPDPFTKRNVLGDVR